MNISWGQIITIFLTQAISAVSTFYTMRMLGMLHTQPKPKKRTRKKTIAKA